MLKPKLAVERTSNPPQKGSKHPKKLSGMQQSNLKISGLISIVIYTLGEDAIEDSLLKCGGGYDGVKMTGSTSQPRDSELQTTSGHVSISPQRFLILFSPTDITLSDDSMRFGEQNCTYW